MIDLKSMDKQQKALLVACVLGVFLIGGIFFLGHEFKKINQEGVKCLNDPLGYGSFLLHEQKNKDYVCSCQEDHGQYFPFINGSFG